MLLIIDGLGESLFRVCILVANTNCSLIEATDVKFSPAGTLDRKRELSRKKLQPKFGLIWTDG